MGMSEYRIIVAGGSRTVPYAGEFTADSLVQAIAQALAMAATCGITAKRVTRIEIEERSRQRGEA